MKQKVEIYAIKFNKLVTSKDIYHTTYTIGVPIFSGTKMITPLKITFDKDGKHITTYFDDKTSHTIFYSDTCEIFKRVIDAKETQNTDDKRGV